MAEVPAREPVAAPAAARRCLAGGGPRLWAHLAVKGLSRPATLWAAVVRVGVVRVGWIPNGFHLVGGRSHPAPLRGCLREFREGSRYTAARALSLAGPRWRWVATMISSDAPARQGRTVMVVVAPSTEGSFLRTSPGSSLPCGRRSCPHPPATRLRWIRQRLAGASGRGCWTPIGRGRIASGA